MSIHIHVHKTKDAGNDVSKIKTLRTECEALYQKITSLRIDNKRAERELDEASSSVARAKGSLKAAIDAIEYN